MPQRCKKNVRYVAKKARRTLAFHVGRPRPYAHDRDLQYSLNLSGKREKKEESST